MRGPGGVWPVRISLYRYTGICIMDLIVYHVRFSLEAWGRNRTSFKLVIVQCSAVHFTLQDLDDAAAARYGAELVRQSRSKVRLYEF